MGRINIVTGNIELTAIQIEKIVELCKLFPGFKRLARNSLGTLYVEWDNTPKCAMLIKEEIEHILNLEMSKSVELYKLYNNTWEETSEDVLDLKDNVSIDTIRGSNKIYSVCGCEYTEDITKNN